MKKIKRHKIKTEKPETSAFSRSQEEHDLAYYIHDRVELMHQVFSVLKYKELKAMAPECVRNLAVGDLQELCTEELLGISSKRLLAILDGAEPPSDTESSSPSPDRMETISLDSISSDEEILSQTSKKKKHKHHRNSKSKSKKRRQKDASPEEGGDLSRASRAGLTVLELLELQARARAIRAQLQNEQTRKQAETAVSESHHSSDNEVEIKEEAPDVVEISSEDEKPDVAALRAATAQKSPSKPTEPETTNKDTEGSDKTQTVTRKVSDLIITTPRAKNRKIKLNRSKVTVTIPNAATDDNNPTAAVTEKVAEPKVADKPPKTSDKSKKQKKNKKKKNVEKDGSDHDEITLQLSDSEKMDLLEDLNEKNYDKLSSSADSESSSSDSDDTADMPSQTNSVTDKRDSNESGPINNENQSKKVNESETIDKENQSKKANESVPKDDCISNTQEEKNDSEISKESPEKQCKENINSEHNATENLIEKDETNKIGAASDSVEKTQSDADSQIEPKQPSDVTTESSGDKNVTIVNTDTELNDQQKQKDGESSPGSEKQPSNEIESQRVIEISTIDDIPTISEEPQSKANVPDIKEKKVEMENSDLNKDKTSLNKDKPDLNTDKGDLNTDKFDLKPIQVDINQEKADLSKEKINERDVSEGELTDRESSEVEACEIDPVVVCISDDEKQKSNKKKKKKDKKPKKEKKSKKSKQDFREGADQNFYKDADKLPVVDSPKLTIAQESEDGITVEITVNDDDVYEILELSDDSSCYEVEGTVLSKEPTAEEIEALSARIDEIKREDIEPAHAVQIDDYHTKSDGSEPETEYISWKDRYLGSKKVKKVLTTANILNALRNKNKELKRKIEESKMEEERMKERKKIVPEETEIQEKVLEEGSIEHYQTLQGSTKYVNPLKEPTEGTENLELKDETTAEGNGVTKQMKKDAKQLLKMYKRLLKNDITKQRDPNKKKKRKKKKQNGGDNVSGNAISP